MKIAVVMMTHRFDQSVLREFGRLRSGIGDDDEAFLLSDGSSLAPESVRPWICEFKFSEIASRARWIIGNDVLRNGHLAWLDFYDRYPGFDYYWLVEYDVVFSGAWKDFFDAFRNRDEDLLCSHLRTYSDEPDWYWWYAIEPSVGMTLGNSDLVRGFLPVTRLSRPGFECLKNAVSSGWCGFHENLIPTLFSVSGLSLLDIGGDGPYTSPELTERFYGGSSDHNGSMRWDPPILLPGFRKNFLYHPVKPLPEVFMPDFDSQGYLAVLFTHLLRSIRPVLSHVTKYHHCKILSVSLALEIASGHHLYEVKAIGRDAYRSGQIAWRCRFYLMVAHYAYAVGIFSARFLSCTRKAVRRLVKSFGGFN
jgi:hypothetical protein